MNIPEQWTFEAKEVASHFDVHVREQLPWYDMAHALVANIVKHYAKPSSVVFDFGSSTGNLAHLLPDLNIIPVDSSSAMCEILTSKGFTPRHCSMLDVSDPFDVAVCFLSLMFLSPTDQTIMIKNLRENRNVGGLIIVVDKFLTEGDPYFAKALSNTTLLQKATTGTTYENIMKKELSLIGSQRPLHVSDLGACIPFFRIGEFAGYVLL